MNTECKRIAYQLACTVAGEAWYGDSLQVILGDVTEVHPLPAPTPSGNSSWWVKMTLGAVDGVAIPPWPGMAVENGLASGDGHERGGVETLGRFVFLFPFQVGRKD
jgi:hypothetical protein